MDFAIKEYLNYSYGIHPSLHECLQSLHGVYPPSPSFPSRISLVFRFFLSRGCLEHSGVKRFVGPVLGAELPVVLSC